ncbi:peptide deformylase [Streptomyces sp. NPDC092296]|uniref:peptide deformylase n=1 Tax=Streptomyces sp. NPDC092296 TaxID=3366012 RepID=UPI0037F9A983
MSQQPAHRPGAVDRRVRVLGVPVDSYPETPPEAERGSVRRVTVVGEEVLHRPCRPGSGFGSEELARLIDDMFATMQVAEGCGLAANQVDVDLRLFVYDCWDESGVRHVGHILDPVLDELGPGERRLVEDDEGCLSVPGPALTVARPDRAVVRGFDQYGNPLVIEGAGYFARCLQHETDHLYGHLYLDRLAKRDRKEALRRMAEQREDVFARRLARTQALGKQQV